jgi:hypothetical protein
VPEIPGNGLDDDCVGGDAPGKVNALVTTRWTGVRAGGVRLLRFEVKEAPPGAQIAVRCRGKRCGFKRKLTRAGADGSARLLSLVPRRRLRQGVTVDVVITAPNMIGKVRRYEVRKKNMTDGRNLCLPPGATRSVRC